MFTFAKGEEYEKRYNAKGAQLEAGLAYEQIKIKDYTIDRVLEMFEVIYASEPFAFPVGDRITEEDLSESTDTAVYVIARQAGEGSDRKVIVNDITNFCFRLLQKPYTEASARPKAKFLMSLTISRAIFFWMKRKNTIFNF